MATFVVEVVKLVVATGLIRFYWVLLGLTGFDCAPLDFSSLERVFIRFGRRSTRMVMVNLEMLPSSTGFHQVFRGFRDGFFLLIFF